MDKKRKVIVVTDGDSVASKAIHVAAKNIGARIISHSTGHPTPLTGKELAEMVKQTPYDPIVLMVDDDGDPHISQGQHALLDLSKDPDIDIIGAVAVASHTPQVLGTPVDESITAAGEIVDGSVDKDGNPDGQHGVKGDTVDILSELDTYVVGIGDPGKMNFSDDSENGAPVTTKALEEIMHRAGVTSGGNLH